MQFAHVQERYLELAATFASSSVSSGLYNLNRTATGHFSFQKVQITVAQRNCSDGIEQTLNTHHAGISSQTEKLEPGLTGEGKEKGRDKIETKQWRQTRQGAGR